MGQQGTLSIENIEHDVVMVIREDQNIFGRAISRSEALRISRQTMENAEKERLEYAEIEAKRGLQWSDEI